jgi:hypothetical protein
MSGLPLFLLLLTAPEDQVSTDSPASSLIRLPRRGHSARHYAVVCANYKTGAVFVVTTGASAVVLDRR